MSGNNPKIAILISGGGSNMRAIIEASHKPGWPGKIALVVSNNSEAGGLTFAKASRIETLTLDHRSFADRTAFDSRLDSELRSRNVDLVVCAGFMRILSAEFVAGWTGQLLNIHPSLLPAYTGLNTHDRAIEDGARIHGCTVHFVTAELDAGPIVMQAAVPVLSGDTPNELAARVLRQEHQIYPAAVKAVASGAVRLENGKVVSDLQEMSRQVVYSPCP